MEIITETKTEITETTFAQAADFINQIETTEEPIVIPIQETLENNTYTREIFIPQGTLIIGYRHKKNCVNILTRGALLIKTSPEDEGVEVVVPENESFIFHTSAGSQKMLYAIEDTIMLGVFTDIKGTTVEEVMEECVYPDSVTEMTHDYHVYLDKLVQEGR